MDQVLFTFTFDDKNPFQSTAGRLLVTRMEKKDLSVRPLHFDLSEREFQLLCWLGRGSTIQEIARKLRLGVKTVRTYRRRILEKMKMKSDRELARYIEENHLARVFPTLSSPSSLS